MNKFQPLLFPLLALLLAMSPMHTTMANPDNPTGLVNVDNTEAISIATPTQNLAQPSLSEHDESQDLETIHITGIDDNPGSEPHQPKLGPGQSVAEITELARALKHDVDLIYQYVHDNIEYMPAFGYKKWATGSILDGKGSPWDQAFLMLKLLRESGYDESTSELVYGHIKITAEQFKSWWRLKDSSAITIAHHLSDTNIQPSTVVTDDGTINGKATHVQMYHAWLRVQIDGQWYHFDPSFKKYRYSPGIDLAAALQYSREGLKAAAKNGAVEQTSAIEGINTPALETNLQSLSVNLIAHLRQHAFNHTVTEVIGGFELATMADTKLRQTKLEHEVKIDSTQANPLTIFSPRIEFTFPFGTAGFYTYELADNKITLTFNENNQPVFDISDIKTITYPLSYNPGTQLKTTIKVIEPYFNQDGTKTDLLDQIAEFNLTSGAAYLLVNGWGATGRNTMEFFRRNIAKNQQNGVDPASKEALGDSLAMFASAYLAQSDQIVNIIEALTDIRVHRHHAIGLVSLADSPNIDLPMNLVSTQSLTVDDSLSASMSEIISGFQFGFESTAIEQSTNTAAESTVSLFGYTSTLTDGKNKFFEAQDKTSWQNTIKPQLSGYSTAALNNIESHLDDGYRIVLPQHGAIGRNDWGGYAFIATQEENGFTESITYKIGNGTHNSKGAYGTEFVGPPTLEQVMRNSQKSIRNNGYDNFLHSAVGDPISWQTGDFFDSFNDLSIGSSNFPFGLSFSRTYNSGAKFKNGTLGWGWDHNFNLTATVDSSGYQGMGEDSAIDTAAAITAIYASRDLISDGKKLDNIVITTLIQHWLMKQLTNNVVMVTQPGKGEQFVKLADGSYNPPPGSASTLTKTADGSFHYRTVNGVEMDFDTDGKAEQWRNANGVAVDFTYSDDKLEKVSNAFGHTLNLSYNSDGKLTEVKDNTGRSVSYSYDDKGNQTSYSNVADKTTTYQYDNPGRMTRLFQPDVPETPVIINVYDALGRVKQQTNIMGQIYHYYFAGKRSEEVDPLGFSQVKQFDDNGLELKFVDKLGHVTENEYDAHQRLIKATSPEGNSVVIEYDTRHNPIKNTLYPKPCSPAPCNNLPPQVTSNTYESTYNQLETTTDPLGRTTTHTYDSKGNLLTSTAPAVFNPATDQMESPVSTFTYSSIGKVLTSEDPTGVKTTFSYDNNTGDLLSTTVDPGDGGLNLTTSHTYSATGDRITTTDPNGNTTTYQYDTKRRLTETKAPAPIDLVVKVEYDEMDRVIKTSRGPAAKQQTVSTTTYNKMGDVETVTNADGAVTTNSYDVMDRLDTITDALGRKTQTIYDANGQVMQVKRAVGTSLEQVYQTYTYSPNGQQLSVTDAAGNRTDFQYDGFNRLERVYYPKADTAGQSSPDDYTQTSYDAVGNPIAERIRSGFVITQEYDSLNRPITRTVPDSPSVITTTTYDLAGRSVKTATNDGQSLTHTYDAAGRVIQTDTHLPSGKTFSVDYQYDAASNRTKVTWPDGYFVDYDYDPLGRMSTVKEKAAYLLASYNYDELSRRTSMTYGNGSTVNYNHAKDNSLTMLEHDHGGKGTSKLKYDYGYDAVNQMTSLKVSDLRLLGGPATSQTNQYQTNGLNQYTDIDGGSISYDGNGNLANYAFNGLAHQYTYNSLNQLVRAKTPTFDTTYHYDPLNRRAAKNINQGTLHVEYLHDGNETIAEYNGADGALIQRFIYGPGVDERIALVRADGQREFYHLNHQGSTVGISDDTGTLTNSFSYDPFGHSIDSSDGNPYRFTGRRLDPETGLYYYRARYYSPELGRFLQADPLGYGDGMNMYAYVGNSPVVFTDPQGLKRTSQSGIPIPSSKPNRFNIPIPARKPSQASIPIPKRKPNRTHAPIPKRKPNLGSFWDDTVIGSGLAMTNAFVSYHTSTAMYIVTDPFAHIDKYVGIPLGIFNSISPPQNPMLVFTAPLEVGLSVASFTNDLSRNVRAISDHQMSHYTRKFSENVNSWLVE